LADAKKICKTYYVKELLPQDFKATELKRWLNKQLVL
jgi:hypothetical protein